MITKLRNLRVDDETWANAKEIAKQRETTVSALIVGFLRSLKDDGIAISLSVGEESSLRDRLDLLRCDEARRKLLVALRLIAVAYTKKEMRRIANGAIGKDRQNR